MAGDADRQPWDQLPDETGAAYKAFLAFRDLGPDRTLGGATRATRRSKAESRGQSNADQAESKRDRGASTAVRGWAKRFRWDERADAWDHFRARTRDRATARHDENEELKRHRQRQKADEVTLAMADQLDLLAARLLQKPLEEVTEEAIETDGDGRPVKVTRTVKPAEWRLRDIPYILKIARELKDRVLNPDHIVEPATGSPVPAAAANLSRADRSGAEEALGSWRNRMREHAITMPSEPPGKPTDDEPPVNGHTSNGVNGNGHHGTNGHG